MWIADFQIWPSLEGHIGQRPEVNVYIYFLFPVELDYNWSRFPLVHDVGCDARKKHEKKWQRQIIASQEFGDLSPHKPQQGLLQGIAKRNSGKELLIHTRSLLLNFKPYKWPERSNAST